VTLDEVFAAASLRAASLVPETSGYLALAIGDATSRLPLSHDDRALLLTTEGGMSSTRRGDVVTPEKAAKAMRDVLARLLAVSSGTMPGLAAAARPREESPRGIDAVIEEIEAALIPVNRAAAQRALARLSRETLRAKEAGKLKIKPKREASVRPPPPPRPAAAVAAAAPRVVFSEPPELAPIPEPPRVVITAPQQQDVFAEPPPLAPRIEPVVLVEAKPVVIEAQPVVDAEPIVVDAQPAVIEPQRIVAIEAEAEAAGSAAPSIALEALLHDPAQTPIGSGSITVAPAAVVETRATPDAPAVVEALSPEIEAETAVRADLVKVAFALPAMEAHALTPSPIAPRFEERDFAEPTPTTLGMAIEIDEAETPFSSMEVLHATALGGAALVEETSAPVVHAAVFEMPVIPAASLAPPSGPKTRADDLLATFAVSCSDAAALREATDCLKKLADLEPTPPPLAIAPPAPRAPIMAAAPVIARPTTPRAPVAAAAPKVARAAPAPLPLPAAKAQPALDALRDQLEEQGRSPRKRGRSGLSLVAALLAGAVVGLVAVTRLRPDLVTSFEERVGPALGSERTDRPAPPAPTLPAPAARPR
jgi:hypothetical protein